MSIGLAGLFAQPKTRAKTLPGVGSNRTGTYTQVPTTGKSRTTSTSQDAAAAAARQRQLAMQNEVLPGNQDAIALNGPTQLRSSGAQPMVDPFAQLAISAASQDPFSNYANNQQLIATQNGTANSGGYNVGNGYQASTKLGQSYRDDYLPGAWDDPEGLIDTFYRVNGMAKGSGDYGTQLQNADNLGILYMALQGNQAFKGNGDFVDWASNYLTNGRQADGRSISPGEIWNALTNPSTDSPLNMYLNNPSLTPEEQVNNMMSSARYGLQTSLPAPILNALLAQMDQMGREFRSLRNTQAGSASFSDYLGSRGASLPQF